MSFCPVMSRPVLVCSVLARFLEMTFFRDNVLFLVKPGYVILCYFCVNLGIITIIFVLFLCKPEHNYTCILLALPS